MGSEADICLQLVVVPCSTRASHGKKRMQQFKDSASVLSHKLDLTVGRSLSALTADFCCVLGNLFWIYKKFDF